MKFLVTGGPVHGKLDAVKIITNKFKGGLMARLADELCALGHDVTYLCSNGSRMPMSMAIRGEYSVVRHDGIDDYMEAVLRLAPEHDSVVLGAAVANLIPLNPLEGKFPSHDYKPGDVIPIDFTIAPRVIDEVRAVAPKAFLFGFKLLSGVNDEELVSAAYEVLLGSRANAVFANDAKNLDRILAVSRDRAVIPLDRRGVCGDDRIAPGQENPGELALWIDEACRDEYYQTEEGIHRAVFQDLDLGLKDKGAAEAMARSLIEANQDRFVRVEQGVVLGTVAVRMVSLDGGFVTTGRGKNEAATLADVYHVHHKSRTVFADPKATPNAPLLATIFSRIPAAQSILHFHQQEEGIPTLPYAPPGTVRDSTREVNGSFNVEHHGCFLVLDGEGNRL